MGGNVADIDKGLKMKVHLITWEDKQAIVIGFDCLDSAIQAAFPGVWAAGLEGECGIEVITVPTVIYRAVDADAGDELEG